jgi:predicted dehydrogenase
MCQNNGAGSGNCNWQKGYPIVPVKTTIVGCGAVAQRLYRTSLQKLERQGILSVTGLVDTHRPNAVTLHPYFRRALIYEDLDKALKSSESELTLVLSPAKLHASHTILALRHGNHVLCEKPMATTEAQCREMLKAAREMDRVLAIGMIRRFFPSFAELRKCILNDELGEIRSFCYREGKVFDWDVKTPAGFSPGQENGAGLLFDIGPHAIDLLIWLFGFPEVVSYADDALGGVEGNILMKLTTPAASGSLQLSWDSPLKNELRVVGTKAEAVLRIDQFDKLAIKMTSGFQERVVIHQYPADTCLPSRRRLSPRLYTQSLYCQLIQVARAIRLGEPPAVNGEAGKHCVGVIESARHCAEPIDMPWLDWNQRETHQALHWTNPRWEPLQLSGPRVSSVPV